MSDGFTRAARLRNGWKGLAAALAVVAASVASLSAVRTVAAASYTLTAGQSLGVNQYLMSTNLGAHQQGFEFLVQADGNTVLYEPAPDTQANGRAIWSTGTHDTAGVVLFMQGDGNLVLYDIPTGHALWSSGTGGHPNAAYHFDMQNDGNGVIYGPSGAIWSTGTWYATNTPSFGGGGPGNNYYGTCVSTTNYICRNTWSSSNRVINFRAIDQFSSTQPQWLAPAQAAVSAWNNSSAPLFYRFTPATNDTFIYLEDNSTGQYDLGTGTYGITWNCYANRTPACTDTPQSGTVVWTEVHLNHDMLDAPGITSADIQHTVAHESGHGMLLAHNPMDSTALMWPIHNTVSVGPNSNDIGASASCANAAFGVRCIYGD